MQHVYTLYTLSKEGRLHGNCTELNIKQVHRPLYNLQTDLKTPIIYKYILAAMPDPEGAKPS